MTIRYASDSPDTAHIEGPAAEMFSEQLFKACAGGAATILFGGIAIALHLASRKRLSRLAEIR